MIHPVLVLETSENAWRCLKFQVMSDETFFEKLVAWNPTTSIKKTWILNLLNGLWSPTLFHCKLQSSTCRWNSRQTEANAMMEPYRREFAEWYSFFGLASQEARKTHRIHWKLMPPCPTWCFETLLAKNKSLRSRCSKPMILVMLAISALPKSPEQMNALARFMLKSVVWYFMTLPHLAMDS